MLKFKNFKLICFKNHDADNFAKLMKHRLECLAEDAGLIPIDIIIADSNKLLKSKMYKEIDDAYIQTIINGAKIFILI